KNKIFLAPMEEVNDPAFRMLCKKAGAGLTYTPLSSPLNPKELKLPDKPVLQIFGNKDILAKNSISLFFKKYNKKVKFWDFNLGCPSALAKKHGFGAYLEDLVVIENILRTMKQNTKKPVTVKIRKSKIAYDILKIAEKYCEAIAIHPRTRAQGYSGEPDLDWAKQFKKKSKIPVIYSGNVDETNYKEFLKFFDYVMIGRASIGHPEIFAKISGNKKFKRSYKDYIKFAIKYNVPWKIMKFQAMQFTKGLEGSRKKRVEIFKLKTVDELKNAINNL
ncbi:MAG: tRNA-dihydrouridine synthase family protein, partial [Nanoarchaeota archaeon]|nr:tRNA-dihydrouridine synthase family protein [Nanoarchaeota archaeon]